MFKFLETQKDWVIKKVNHLTNIMPLSGTAPSHAISDSIHFGILPLRFTSTLHYKWHLWYVHGPLQEEATSSSEGGDKEHFGRAETTDPNVTSSTRSCNGPNWKEAERYSLWAAKLDLATATILLTQILNFENEIVNELDCITSAFQQAQLRQLSPLLLSAEQLSQLMEELKLHSAASRSKLLMEQMSDLFQIDVSYLFDGEDITLLLHVPTVRKEACLCLMKFLPFPLSFSDSHFLFPQPANN